jgi:hypothetical protein
MPHGPSTSVVVCEPVFAESERLPLAAFLAGYRGPTRDAYALDLRQYVAWCADRRLALFPERRADIETWARTPEERGRARATVAHRLCPVAGGSRPGTRAPDPDDSAQRRQDRQYPAGTPDGQSHRPGIGERSEGPIFTGAGGRRLDRHGAARIVRRVARRAGITKPIGTHTLRHAFITAPPGRRRAAPGRPRGRLPLRSPDHHALRPGQSLLSCHATHIVSTFIAGPSR